MHIAQGFKSGNTFWKYIQGSVLLILASMVGQLFFAAVVVIDSLTTGKQFQPVGLNMMTYFDSNTTLFFLLSNFVFVLAALFFIVKLLHHQTILSVTTSRKKVDWNRVLTAFGIWSLFTIGSTLIMYFANPTSFEVNFKPIPFLILALIGIIMIPLQTSAEEYIFRGYLMQGFAVLARNKWFPLVMTSLIFGGLHFFNPEVEKMGPIIMVYYIGTGLFLGILTLMDEGMELALGFHAANNTIGALLITSDWTAFQTNSILKDVSNPSAGIDVILPVFLIYPILLFIFSKKYQWTNWKEKLTGRIPSV